MKERQLNCELSLRMGNSKVKKKFSTIVRLLSYPSLKNGIIRWRTRLSCNANSPFLRHHNHQFISGQTFLGAMTGSEMALMIASHLLATVLPMLVLGSSPFYQQIPVLAASQFPCKFSVPQLNNHVKPLLTDWELLSLSSWDCNP